VKILPIAFVLFLSAASACAIGDVHASSITISPQQSEYVLDRPIVFEVKNSSGKRLLYWVEVNRLGSDGEWYLTYSSLLGMRQDSEPAMAILKSKEEHVLFWLPTIDPQFRDMFNRTESRTFRFTLTTIRRLGDTSRAIRSGYPEVQLRRSYTPTTTPPSTSTQGV
jgi:hypothetical protein